MPPRSIYKKHYGNNQDHPNLGRPLTNAPLLAWVTTCLVSFGRSGGFKYSMGTSVRCRLPCPVARCLDQLLGGALGLAPVWSCHTRNPDVASRHCRSHPHRGWPALVPCVTLARHFPATTYNAVRRGPVIKP